MAFEAGVSYTIAPNTELNVYYKDAKYKELEFSDFAGYKYDLSAKGPGAGLTFKF